MVLEEKKEEEATDVDGGEDGGSVAMEEEVKQQPVEQAALHTEAAVATPDPVGVVEADLPHDPHTCPICSTAPRLSLARRKTSTGFTTDGKEERDMADWRRMRRDEEEEAGWGDEEADDAVSLLQMDDLVFLIWDYLPLSQVWRFRLLCPRWRDLLHLKPGSEEPPPADAAEPTDAAAADDAADDEDYLLDADDDFAWPALAEDRALRVARDDEDDDGPAAGLGRRWIEDLHREQRAMLQQFQRGVHVHARDWKEDLQGMTEEDLAVILDVRTAGVERGYPLNARARRQREWTRADRNGRRRTKRMRKLDRRTATPATVLRTAVTASEVPLPQASSASSPSSPSLPPHPPVLATVVSDSSSSSSSSSSSFSLNPSLASTVSLSPSSSPPSFSSPSLSSSSSSSAAASASALERWSRRSYLRRLGHASLSLLPNCTPSLNPATLASLSSVTSLHLYAFPFVVSVFSSEREGEDWADEEVRLLAAEKDAYEREEKRKVQEASEKERRNLRLHDAAGDRRERLLLNAAWALRRENREEMEDMLRVMEIRGIARRHLAHRDAADDGAAGEDASDDIEGLPPRHVLDARLLQLNERERDPLLHPFWAHAMERRAPKNAGHLRLLPGVASRLTSLVFSPQTLCSADLTTLSSLHSLTSLSLHPHASEGIRPPEIIATLFSSLPHLTTLSLGGGEVEEASTFPLSFIPSLSLLSLRSLSIHTAQFSLDAIHSLAALSTLTSLSLSFQLEPLPLPTFDALSALTHLASLSLHIGTRLSYCLPPSLFALSSLTSLSLFGTLNVHQSHFHLLPSLPALQRLRISDLFASLDDVVQHVVECRQLRVMDVRGAALTFRKREQIRFERTDVRLIDSFS